MVLTIICAQFVIAQDQSEAQREAVRARLKEISRAKEPAYKMIQQAEAMLIQGKLQPALALCYRDQLILEPFGSEADYDARLLRAEINLADKKYSGAISELTELISYNRMGPRIMMGLAIGYASKNQPLPSNLHGEFARQAAYLLGSTDFSRLLAPMGSGNVKRRLSEALTLRGISFLHDNKLKRSLLDLKTAHQIEPASQLVSLMYAYSLHRSGDKPTAIAQARLAAKGTTTVSKAAKNLLYRLGVDD
jgi:hypothetical protein